MAKGKATQGEKNQRACSSLPGTRKPTTKSKRYSAAKKGKKRNVPTRCCVATWRNARQRNKKFYTYNVVIYLGVPMK